MDKPIMVNGFPRSGTTYLYRYLKWKFGRALFEPLTSPQVAFYDVDEELGRKLILNNPFNKKASFYRSWWIYDERDLEDFLEHIRGIAFKEVSLHFYLDLVKRMGWEVYHIIRHPADNYISYVNYFHKGRFLGRRITFHLLVKLARLGFDSAKMFAMWEMATRLVPVRLFRKVRSSFDAAFVYMWVTSNKEALKSVGEDKLIVYEDPETLKKLPDFEEFERTRPFAPRKYPEREKVLRKLLKEAERLEIADEFNSLLELFPKA